MTESLLSKHAHGNIQWHIAHGMSADVALSSSAPSLKIATVMGVHRYSNCAELDIGLLGLGRIV